MGAFCRLFSCYKRPEDPQDKEDNLYEPSRKDVQHASLVDAQNICMNCLMLERDGFIWHLKQAVAPLSLYLDEKYKSLFLEKEKSRKSLEIKKRSHDFYENKVSYEELFSDVLSIAIDVVSFYSKELKAMLEDKTLIIEQQYSQQAQKMKMHLVEIFSQENDSFLLQENVKDFFMLHFSLISPFQISKEIDALLISVKSRAEERCFFSCLVEEKTFTTIYGI